MEKDLPVFGTGSPSGKKRRSAGGDDEDAVVGEELNLELSLGGAIFGGAAATSKPKVDGDSRVTIAQATVSLVAQAPVPAVGAALFAAGAQIASSLLDGGNGAASAGIHFAPAAALSLVMRVPVSVAGTAFGASQAPPPRASPAACSAHRPVRWRVANASPPHPPTIAGGDPPAPPTNGIAPPLGSPPFPWATNRVAIHHPISHLSALGITTVDGEVQCIRCNARKTISYDIASKFQEIRDFVSRNVHDMDDRAPAAWLNQTGLLRDCDGCGQRGTVRPVIPAEKERINWVFLLLGQKLGLCTLDQLKYFCAQTRRHRTGAKDRVLYSTYMELCNQLCPDRLFNLTAERQNRGQQYC
ncbi:hypothetical protein ACQ4PT_006750 [Festuca glaucescens]